MNLMEYLKIDGSSLDKDHKTLYFTEQLVLELEIMAKAISRAIARRKQKSTLSRNTVQHTELYARMIVKEVLGWPSDLELSALSVKQIGHYLKSLEALRNVVTKDPTRWLIWCETNKLAALMKSHFTYSRPMK